VDSSTVRVTSGLLWRATFIALLIDLPLLVLVGRFVSSELFARLKWYLAGTALVLYAALWGTFGSVYFWDAVYSHVFPAWSRWALPAMYGPLFGALALLFWRMSVHARKWPAVWFVLLGGLVSLVGHGIGVRRGLMRVPLLTGASVTSALVFGVFEFVLYWCAIVGLAALARQAGRALRVAGGA
jgi:hypothetical protein